MTANDYTLDELMVVTLARRLRDGERVMHGVASVLPATAIQLARLTHAPDLVCINLEGVDPRPQRWTLSTEYFRLAEGAVSVINLPKLFEYAQRGYIDAAFFSGVQMDRVGNVNTSAIGDYDRPKVRLTGGAGQAILCHTVGRIIFWFPQHTRQRFPEKVDFITLPGHHPNVKKRIDKIITNLAVMGFDPATGFMQLESLHPGVSLDEVRDNTGFELIVPPEVPTTEPPTARELEVLRTVVDPLGVRKSGV